MTDPGRAVWEDVLAHLQHAHPNICRRWFAQLEPLGVSGGAMGIRAHSDLHRDYLRREGLDAFNDAVRTVTGQLIAVRFLGPDDPWGEDPSQKSSAAAGAASPTTRGGARGAGRGAGRGSPVGGFSHDDALHAPGPARAHRVSERPEPGAPSTVPISPDFGFDTLVVGAHNRLAHAAAEAVCASPGHAYNPLFVHAGVGLGKTHLLQAICLEIVRRRPSAQVRYISCETFITEFTESVRAGRMTSFRDAYRDADVLLIDDIHCISRKDSTQEEFFHTFNALYQQNRQIVLSSDAAPDEIPHLEDRLVSRFQWGLVSEIAPPGFETRVQILKRKAELRSVALPDDVANLVAEHMTQNVRQLEGAIAKLVITAAVEGRPIDMELAHRAIDVAPGVSAGPTIETIMSAVSDFYKVKHTDLVGKRRHKSVTEPRQVCMYLARAHTPYSLEEIGSHFGGRDHTTVMHAVRKITKRRGDDPDFRSVVSTLEQRLSRRTPGRD